MKLIGRLKLCKQYCEKLLKDENLWDNALELKQNAGTVEEIASEKEKKAMSKINKKSKASWSSSLSIEAVPVCIVDCTLVKVRYDMISGKGMPTSRRQSVLIPLYKEKSDSKECTSSRSLKMLEHIIKVVERVFEERIRWTVEINGMQIGFVPGKNTMDSTVAVKQPINT